LILGESSRLERDPGLNDGAKLATISASLERF